MRSLQCARAIAALLVVYFHAVIQLRLSFAWRGEDYVLLGRSGVDIFFVLSGLLMWRTTQDDAQTPLLFYRKRLARIAPLYWTLTLVAAMTALTVPAVLKSTRFDPAHLMASLAFVPWPNPAAAPDSSEWFSPVIVPGWTLNFEIAFYVLFGLALAGPRRWRLGRLTVIFAGFIGVVAAFGPACPMLAFYDPFLILEFLLGVCLGIAIERKWRLTRAAATPLLVGALACLLALDALNPPVSRLFSLGLPAALGLYAAISVESACRLPNLPWLERLGDASFSIYLTHIFVLTGLRIVFGRVMPEHAGVLAPPVFLLAALLASSIVGLVTFRFIERPLGRCANRLLGLGRREIGWFPRQAGQAPRTTVLTQ